MNKLKRIISVMILAMLSIASYAQTEVAESTDFMRSNGKIYVVIAVIVAIFAGIIIYLVRLDRKLTKLEKNHFKSL